VVERSPAPDYQITVLTALSQASKLVVVAMGKDLAMLQVRRWPGKGVHTCCAAALCYAGCLGTSLQPASSRTQRAGHSSDPPLLPWCPGVCRSWTGYCCSLCVTARLSTWLQTS
jgi:hypothetical protein